MTDFAMQRLNMVESQLRPSDITDRRILRAMGAIRREVYLPSHVRALAYMDEDIRIAGSGKGASRSILAPRTLALLIQLARIEPTEAVLEIGCGTGYLTAVLARLARHVTAVESEADLASAAAATFAGDDVANVQVVTGALAAGHADGAPYDAIVVNGAVAQVPAALLDQLKDGGRLVAIAAGEGIGHATVWHRHGVHFDRRAAFDARATLLPGFELLPEFLL